MTTIGKRANKELTMPGYNAFQVPTLGMRSQAHALNTIGINVANVNSGGFKRTDTQFETLISKTLQNESDLGGIATKDYQRIDEQGALTPSGRNLDVAINGNGFFYLSPTLEVSTNVYFTRDGSFQMGTADGQTSSVTADDGSTITVANGYLVDKNGYYVLGAIADPETGAFSASTLSPLRIDEWAFKDRFTSTSTANLGLNLPSNNTIVTDHATAVLKSNDGFTNTNLETYIIEVVDSNGAKQSAQMNFTKKQVDRTDGSGVSAVWEVSATSSRASSPQIDTVMLGGDVEPDDTYSVTIDGTTITYTVLGTESGLSDVRNAMVTAINANATIAAKLTASAGSNAGEITLTAGAAGTEFTTTGSSTNVDRAQVDEITIAGTIEAGDEYSFTLNGTTVTYTATGAEADIDAIRSGFISAINANATINALVSASVGAESGKITVTGQTTGTPYTATVATPTTGATVDNSAAIATSITALTGKSNTTSVASKTETHTTAAQTITFNADGDVSTTQTASTFSLTFADGATATVAIDWAQMKQFGADFLKFNYDHNGLIKASMTSTRFDNAGQILGTFQDGTQRAVYKLPLAQFHNPNGLEMMNGMVFRETQNSGSPSSVFVDASGQADFVPFAMELSNVDITKEFSRLIMTQNAYNSSATVFKTIDEMVTVARDLKA